MLDRVSRVAIAMPTAINHSGPFDPGNFMAAAVSRRIAEFEHFPSRQPEFGRNVAIKKFLTHPDWQKHSHLFFLDSDTWPDNPLAIERLLSHNKPVVAGLTPIMMQTANNDYYGHWSAMLPAEREGDPPKRIRFEDELPKGLFKAHQTGGTTILIRRDVLEKLKPPYQQATYNDDVTWWRMTEDFYFCRKIREAGYDIWIDPEVKCHHLHQFDLLEFYEWIQRHKTA
jgi:hypothetical protein